MAQGAPTIESEDVPLDEARRMSRRLRMDLKLYHALKEKIQSLANTATHMPLPEGTRPTTMKHRMLHVAAGLCIPVTIRRVPGRLISWRSTDEDLQQATKVVEHLQGAPRPAHTARRGKRRPWPRGTANTASIRTLMHGYHTCG